MTPGDPKINLGGLSARAGQRSGGKGSEAQSAGEAAMMPLAEE